MARFVSERQPGTRLRIAFLPAANENTASSRLRAYALARALRDEGVDAGTGIDGDPDVLVVQKRVTREILRVARRARERGTIVCYDVDDLGDALWWWTPRKLFQAMLEITDLVITGTPGQREILEQEHGIRGAAVLPCCVDYGPEAPVAPAETDASPLRVVWFGNNSNFDLVGPYLETLAALTDVQPVVVIDRAAIRKHAARHPEVEFRAWSRTSFVPILRSCHVSCLMHDGGLYDRAKSNNRMTTSIVWGVPAVVSRTPEYERTAREAGVEYALFDGPDQLPAAIERLRSAAARDAYLRVAQPEIWLRYSPRTVARQFLGLVGGAASS